MKQEIKRIARQVNGKLTTVFDPESLDLNVAGKSFPVPKRTEKQQLPRRHGFRDLKVVRLGRIHLPVAYPRSDLTSLRYPSPQRFRITGRLTPG